MYESNKKQLIERTNDDEINLIELFNILWSNKILIITVTFCISIASIYYSLILPNVYKSEALLKISDFNESGGQSLGQLGGLASIAGITIPSSQNDKSQEAIKRIQSFAFYSNHISPEFPPHYIMASAGWDNEKNRIIYNENDYNSISKKWVRPNKPNRKTTPSSQESFKFYQEMINLSQDEGTSFIKVSAKHHSPYMAQELVELVIKKINKTMRDNDKNTSEKSLDFLNNQLNKNNTEELKQAIISLQENQMKNLMFIEANQDYVFQVIDPAIAPEIKLEPKRSTIVILATIFGLIASSILALIFNYIKNKEKI